MAKRLIVSRNAYLDIDRIIEFNDKRNQSDRYSREFVKALFAEFDELKKLPFMSMKTSKGEDMILVWDKYYIYYEITDSAIEIKAIYHQKENINR